MDRTESPGHSFIVRIWIEETAAESGCALWRGHVTHVPSGERRYVQSPDDILAFVLPYLAMSGVDVGLWWPIKLLIRQLAAELEKWRS